MQVLRAGGIPPEIAYIDMPELRVADSIFDTYRPEGESELALATRLPLLPREHALEVAAQLPWGMSVAEISLPDGMIVRDARFKYKACGALNGGERQTESTIDGIVKPLASSFWETGVPLSEFETYQWRVYVVEGKTTCVFFRKGTDPQASSGNPPEAFLFPEVSLPQGFILKPEHTRAIYTSSK